jgi:hypothetical protein
VKIVGTGHFQGDVGSYQGETHTIEGRAPFIAYFPYKEADSVFADIERDSGDAVKLVLKDKIKVKGELKDKVIEQGKGSTFLMWESPRRDTR